MARLWLRGARTAIQRLYPHPPHQRLHMTAASATFALKAAVWFRRGRLDMVAPDSRAIACPLSGRNSTYRPVQISGARSWQRGLAPGVSLAFAE